MRPTTQIRKEPKPPFRQKKLSRPGTESKMKVKPKWQAPLYKPADKLLDKTALITGGDSGIGRAVAVLYAREGADVAITYLPEEWEDAVETKKQVQSVGRKCLLIQGDLCDEEFCERAVETTVEQLGGLDILVSNAAHQIRKSDIGEITYEEWDKTFRVNVYAYFLLAKTALKHMKPGSAIIATSSETAMTAPKDLLDYSSTKSPTDSHTTPRWFSAQIDLVMKRCPM